MNKSIFLILVGIAAGVFLTSRKGAGTRQWILDVAENMRETGRNELEKTGKEAAGLGDTMKEAAKGIADAVVRPVLKPI